MTSSQDLDASRYQDLSPFVSRLSLSQVQVWHVSVSKVQDVSVFEEEVWHVSVSQGLAKEGCGMCLKKGFVRV
jgi:hypothetical protein